MHKMMAKLAISLAAVVACIAAVSIHDKEYTSTVLLNDVCFSHIIMTPEGTLLYVKGLDVFYMKPNSTESTKMPGLPDNIVWDIVMDSNGLTWIPVASQLYTYDSKTESIELHTREGASIFIWRLAVQPDGTLYASTSSNSLYFLRDKDFILVANIRVSRMAFTQNGDMYFTKSTASTLYRRRGGPEGAETELNGLPVAVEVVVMDVDKESTLYIATAEGLYYLLSGTDTAVKVNDITGPVQSLGIGADAAIYIGTDKQIIQLSVASSEDIQKQKLIKENEKTTNKIIKDKAEASVSEILAQLESKMSSKMSQIASEIDKIYQVVKGLQYEIERLHEKEEIDVIFLNVTP